MLSVVSAMKGSNMSDLSSFHMVSSMEDDLVSNNTKLIQELKLIGRNSKSFKIDINPIVLPGSRTDEPKPAKTQSRLNATKKALMGLVMNSLSTVEDIRSEETSNIKKRMSDTTHVRKERQPEPKRATPSVPSDNQSKLTILIQLMRKLKKRSLGCSYTDLKSYSQFQSLLIKQSAISYSVKKPQNITSMKQKRYRQLIKAHYSALYASQESDTSTSAKKSEIDA